MRHTRFTTRLLNRPQLITPAAGAAVAHVLLPGARLDGFDGSAEVAQRDPREYAVTGRTAVVPIVGELVHRGGGMDAMSGLTSYQNLQDMLTDALTDPSVTGIVLDIDSPGGEAGGNLDLAEWLASQRGMKPIVASINSQACSGAYSIASAADQIMIGPDGSAGSIGVVTYHVDLSRALANEGVVVTYLYAGDRKIDGNPTMPLSPEASASIQAGVDSIYTRFCSVVAANRGLSVAAVQNTQAGIFYGQAAITAGLADQIGTLEDTIVNVATRSATPGLRLAVNRSAGGTRMASTDPNPPTTPAAPPPAPAPAPSAPAVPLAAPAPGEAGGEPGAHPVDKPAERQPNPPASPGYGPADPVEVAEACAAAGYPQLTAGLLRGKASMAAVQLDIDRAKAITDVAKQLNQPGMAAPAIAGGVSLETFRQMAFSAKAGAEPAINTAVPAKTGAQVGALDERAILSKMGEQRAAASAAARRH